jgi:hypothetical protein
LVYLVYLGQARNRIIDSFDSTNLGVSCSNSAQSSGPQPENDGQTPRFCSNSPRDTNRAPSPWRSLRLHFTYKDAPLTTVPSLHHLVKYHERPRQRFGGVCPARLKKIAGRNPYRRHSALVVTALVIRATNAQSEGRLGRNN